MFPQINTCSVEGCEKPVKYVASCLCGMHDMRLRRYGSLEAPPRKCRAICSVEGCDSFVKSDGLCPKHHQRWLRNGSPDVTRKVANGTPFLERIARYGRWEGECLVWTGARDRKGYGMIQMGQQNMHVTRALWKHLHGPIPDGMLICHHCDNPPCFREDHLYLGTASDNMHDMYDRERHKRGPRS